MTGLAVSDVVYWIDASTVGANWETTGFDDSSWTAAPTPGAGYLIEMFDYSGLGQPANVGSVGGSDSDAANVFIRFWIPKAVTLRLIGNVDDWIHTIYINGSSAYTETSQTAHAYDESFTEADGLLAHESNLIAIRTVNKFSANQWAFSLQDDSTYEGSSWMVGYVSLGQ